MSQTDPYVELVAVDMNTPDDAPGYPTHIRVDEEAIYVDAHLEDGRQIAFILPFAILEALKATTAQIEAMPRHGGLLN